MPDLVITSLAALANGAILLALTVIVILHRRRDGVVLGDNGDRVLSKKIRGQANAAEQIPVALILMGLAEAQGGGGAVLSLLAVLLTVGRAMHGAYFAVHGLTWRLRFWGMILTLTAQGGLLLWLFVVLLT